MTLYELFLTGVSVVGFIATIALFVAAFCWTAAAWDAAPDGDE